MFILISLKTEIARTVRGPKLQGSRAESAFAESYLMLKIFVMWLKQIIKFSVKVVNLETISDLQSWCRTWPRNESSRIGAKLVRKHREACKISWSRIGRLWKSLLKSLHVYTTRIANKWDYSESSTKCEQRGLDEKGRTDSMECYTYMRNVQDLLSDGKTPHERRFGEPCKEPIIPFSSLVEYFFFFRKTSQEFINWRTVPRIRSVRGVSMEGRFNGCRHWGVGDDGRIGNLPKKISVQRK